MLGPRHQGPKSLGPFLTPTPAPPPGTRGPPLPSSALPAPPLVCAPQARRPVHLPDLGRHVQKSLLGSGSTPPRGLPVPSCPRPVPSLDGGIPMRHCQVKVWKSSQGGSDAGVLGGGGLGVGLWPSPGFKLAPVLGLGLSCLWLGFWLLQGSLGCSSPDRCQVPPRASEQRLERRKPSPASQHEDSPSIRGVAVSGLVAADTHVGLGA